MICTKGKKLQVLNSNAGYYIGVFDDEGPYCRMSEYYRSRELAEAALESGVISERVCVENKFCSGGFCIPN
jgi:hypothetical protein